eukprot:15351088-Ditylum_brightwellii.AAC.3
MQYYKCKDIDYMGLPEINVETTQHAVIKMMKTITKAAFNHVPIQMTNSLIPTKYFYKPGSTMCVLCGNCNTCKIKQGDDQYRH